MTGQALNSRGPEGRAAAGGAYDDLGVELRTAGGTPALPHGVESAQPRWNPGQGRGVLREVPQGDAGPGRYREEPFERVVQLKDSGGCQPDQQCSGQRLGERSDLDEAVQVVAVADLGRAGAAEYADRYVGHGVLMLSAEARNP